MYLPTHSLASLGLCFAGLLFAMQVVVQRFAATAAIPVPLLVASGMLGVGLVLTPFWLRRRALSLPRREWLGLAALAAVRMTTLLSYFAAYRLLPPSNAVLLFYLGPLFVLLQTWLFGTEKLRWMHLLVFAMAFGGIGIALQINQGANLLGIGYGLLAGLGLSWQFILIKAVIPPHKSLLNFGLSSALLSLAIVLVAPVFVYYRSDLLVLFTWHFGAISLALMVFTLLPILITVVCVQVLGPGSASLFSLSEPAFVILIACLAGWERFTFNMLIGALMVIGALLLLHFSSTPGAPVRLEPEVLDALEEKHAEKHNAG